MSGSEYAGSGIPWITELPTGWQVAPLFTLCSERKRKNLGNREGNVLSLSYGRIVRRDVTTNFGLLPESFETYNVVDPGDIVLRLTDLQNDHTSLRVGLSPERGIITSAYVTLRVRQTLAPEYAFYLLHAYDVQKVFYGFGGGVRQSMKFEDLRRLPLVVPPAGRQRAIASFLDRKTVAIDALIAKKERLIGLLHEKRQVLITLAMTKGLDPSVPTKESGIEWIGSVPTHWKVVALSRVTRIVRGRFSHRPRNDPRFYDGRHPFIQTGDVANAGRHITEYSQTLNDLGFSVSKQFPKGTLAMVITGARPEK